MQVEQVLLDVATFSTAVCCTDTLEGLQGTDRGSWGTACVSEGGGVCIQCSPTDHAQQGANIFCWRFSSIRKLLLQQSRPCASRSMRMLSKNLISCSAPCSLSSTSCRRQASWPRTFLPQFRPKDLLRNRQPRERLQRRTWAYYSIERVGYAGDGGGEALGVVLVAETSDGLSHIADLYRRATKRQNVFTAHMDDAEPSIERAVRGCVQGGATRVVVVPYFLSGSAQRVQQELPFAVATVQMQFPRIKCVTAEGVGIDSVLVDLLEGRVKVLEPTRLDDVSERGWSGGQIAASNTPAERSYVAGSSSAAALPGGRQQVQQPAVRVSEWLEQEPARRQPQPERQRAASSSPGRATKASPPPQRPLQPQRPWESTERGWGSAERAWESPERGWSSAERAWENPERAWASGSGNGSPSQAPSYDGAAERSWGSQPQPGAAERSWREGQQPQARPPSTDRQQKRRQWERLLE